MIATRMRGSAFKRSLEKLPIGAPVQLMGPMGIPTLTEESAEDWKFEFGKIDRPMLSRYITDLHTPVYYIVGPPTMVATLKELLGEIDLDELQIKSEDFAGY